MFCGICIVLVFIHIDITSVSLQCRGLSTSSSWLSGPSGSGGTISSPRSATSCGETLSTLRRPMPSVLSWRRKYVGGGKKTVWIVSTIRDRFQKGRGVKTSWIDILNEDKLWKISPKTGLAQLPSQLRTRHQGRHLPHQEDQLNLCSGPALGALWLIPDTGVIFIVLSVIYDERC